MPSNALKRALVLPVVLALSLFGLQFLLVSAPASASTSGLVIDEVYGGGNNSGATFQSDFIELKNTSAAALSLTGMSLQYRAAGSTGTVGASNVFALPNATVPAGQTYLVAGAGGTTNGSALPTPDVTSTLNLAGTGGQVFLASSATAIDPNSPAGAAGSTFTSSVIDFVGWGTSATSFEGAKGPATTNPSSITRNGAGADADNNSTDFTVSTPPTPLACTGCTTSGGGGGSCPAAPQTIAQIEGDNTDTSPCAGSAVSTTGVVTGVWSTGGFSGFEIQTGGSPSTPDASDAVFVYGGPSGFASYPALAATVDVTGIVSEFAGQTEIDSATWTNAGSSQPAVVPLTVIPGTDCALPGDTCLAGAALDAAREKHEGELYEPTAAYTVTDPYDGSPAPSTSSSFFGEIGLAANSSSSLMAPTEVADAQDHTAITNRTNYNNAHLVVVDDGASTNYSSAANTGLPFPWLTLGHYVRDNAAVSFDKPFVLSYRNSEWKLEPQSQVTDTGADKITFAQDRPVAPDPVGGNLKLATFNVLNYFTTLGADVAGTDGCSAFNDKDGNPITVDTCTAANGPRGAWTAASQQRQQDKIVHAINKIGADIMSLEEIENNLSVDGADRDHALSTLVAALNADAGSTRWAYVPSPASLPSGEDVIRTGFIYNPATVTPVGAAQILIGATSFDIAREPLAQEFKKKGDPNSNGFAVIVNHFKSKGSGNPDPDGQGDSNDTRIAEANDLVTFANSFKTSHNVSKVFLSGDFNAYSDEDPVQVLETAGYVDLAGEKDPNEKSYNFGGLDGSLDHVFANAAAEPAVTGVDIWNINANESVYYEYSRFNYNTTNLYDSSPYRASDHNPEVVGLQIDSPSTRDIQVLSLNDFHGRIQNDPTSATAGAAEVAGAVEALRAQNDDTVFAAAGDLVGASTFESFIAHDKPTIDAMNAAGLEVSSVGNHEFDQGDTDLTQRIMAPYDATTNPYGGAQWQYLADNVRKKSDNSELVPPTWTKTFGSVKVGFVGAVTEHLPELVSPAGIADVNVTNLVTETNAAAAQLKADGADVVVMLVHEGAPSTDCASMDDDPTSDIGRIITGISPDVDAIVSGHTHLLYDCEFPVAAWQTQGRPVTQRPVVSAGSYGQALNKLDFTVDTTTGQVTALTHSIVNLKAAPAGPFTYPIDQHVQDIVDAAVTNSNVLGAQVLGKVGGPFNRAKLADGTTENRGGESTLGNLVAEAQKFATQDHNAQIAFMNPGGLRADMVGDGTGAFPRDLTYKQAATVQPFANELITETLTGAQIKAALENQWQPSGASRPFLKLGTSKGFTYTYDPSAATGSHITAMYLNGAKIAATDTFHVTVNSFLAAGGDNFTALGQGTDKQDTGQTDLQGMVSYMAQFATNAVPVNYAQNSVGVQFPADAPATYHPGDHVRFDVSSFAMTNSADTKDSVVQVRLGSTVLGSATLDNAAPAALPGFDDQGKASVDVVLPDDVALGAVTLTLVGATTGTSVPVTISTAKSDVTLAVPDVSMVYGQSVTVPVQVSGGATGSVTLVHQGTTVGTGTISNGTASVTLPARSLPPGSDLLVAQYAGDVSHNAATHGLTVTVSKASSATTASASPQKVRAKKTKVTVSVQVAATGVTPSGQVTLSGHGVASQTVTIGSGGSVAVKVGKFKKPGTYTLTVAYAGDQFVNGSSTTVTVKVTKAKNHHHHHQH